ncbi:hypothetical protein G7072_06850 [Nocardioides sp. HDW12B]|uniref:hypothetical protein n=1 Tax=Nocardioides sp. HDW12B TaxID=2714939 RepID=UPI001408C4A7|nr:hypothetical protein [Nocardioides sp. HDW12B]QIK66098.1 hypothetical protein G7072_06850 [Nocardioides sp. HDW12B]
MKLYADLPARRAVQATGDLLLVAWVVGSVLLARLVHDAVMLLAEPGEQVNEASAGLAERLREAGSAVDGAPLIGDELRTPFDGAGDAADRLAAAGLDQVDAVETLAFWLALAIGVVPILLALALYVPRRWAFAREAAAGQRFVDTADDLDLFALRALAHQPLHRLARISDDPAGAWRRGDPDAVRALARLELSEVGLRPPG